MKKLHISLLVLTAALLTSCGTPKSEATAIALFNGKDLNGWNAYLVEENVPMADVWSVQDGLLVCKGQPMGYLFTKESFTNYRLVVEWRWAPGGKPGNSGVLMRINGDPMALPRSIEAQLASGNAGDLYGFHGMKIKGDSTRFRQIPNHDLGGELSALPKITGNEKTPGQWNTYEIEVLGPSITAMVNGQLVNQATDCEVMAGPIGLQSEGGEIHFRKVELTPLTLP